MLHKQNMLIFLGNRGYYCGGYYFLRGFVCSHLISLSLHHRLRAVAEAVGLTHKTNVLYGINQTSLKEGHFIYIIKTAFFEKDIYMHIYAIDFAWNFIFQGGWAIFITMC